METVAILAHYRGGILNLIVIISVMATVSPYERTMGLVLSLIFLCIVVDFVVMWIVTFIKKTMYDNQSQNGNVKIYTDQELLDDGYVFLCSLVVKDSLLQPFSFDLKPTDLPVRQ